MSYFGLFLKDFYCLGRAIQLSFINQVEILQDTYLQKAVIQQLIFIYCLKKVNALLDYMAKRYSIV